MIRIINFLLSKGEIWVSIWWNTALIKYLFWELFTSHYGHLTKPWFWRLFAVVVMEVNKYFKSNMILVNFRPYYVETDFVRSFHYIYIIIINIIYLSLLLLIYYGVNNCKVNAVPSRLIILYHHILFYTQNNNW